MTANTVTLQHHSRCEPPAPELDARRRTALAVAAGASALWIAASLARRAYSFKDRAVLLTGGTRGLGLAMARRLAVEGARVWLLARSSDELQRARKELEADGPRVWTIEADVSEPGTAHSAVQEVVRVAGRLDVLINNAGVITVAPFEQTPLSDIAESLDTHFWGPARLIKAALPYMRQQGEGRIVNITSIGGRIAVPHLSAYAAGKFAMVGLSETLRAELRKDGILVTTVSPGLLRTGSYGNAKVRGEHAQEAQWFSAMAATPLTSKNAARAAAQILEACRRGRATTFPGWQARVAHIAAAVAPETVAAVTAFTASHLLPAPTDTGRDARLARDLELGWVRYLLPARTREKYHQPDGRTVNKVQGGC